MSLAPFLLGQNEAHEQIQMGGNKIQTGKDYRKRSMGGNIFSILFLSVSMILLRLYIWWRPTLQSLTKKNLDFPLQLKRCHKQQHWNLNSRHEQTIPRQGPIPPPGRLDQTFYIPMSAFGSKSSDRPRLPPNAHTAASAVDNLPTSRELGVVVPAPNSKEVGVKTERKPWAHFVAGA